MDIVSEASKIRQPIVGKRIDLVPFLDHPFGGRGDVVPSILDVFPGLGDALTLDVGGRVVPILAC